MIADRDKTISEMMVQLDGVIEEAAQKIELIEKDTDYTVNKIKADFDKMFSMWEMIDIEHNIKMYCGAGLAKKINSVEHTHIMTQILKTLMDFVSQDKIFDYTHVEDYVVAWSCEFVDSPKFLTDPVSQIKSVIGLVLTKKQFQDLKDPRDYKAYLKLAKIQSSITKAAFTAI